MMLPTLKIIKSELNISNQEKLACEAICFGIPSTKDENIIQNNNALFQFYNI